MKIPVLWYRGSNSSWCHALPKWLMQSASYEHFTKYSDVPSDGAIVVIKADEVDMDELNYDLARFKWLLLMVCSNEEGKWNTDALDRRQPTKVWLQSPAPHQKAERYFPWGWAAEINAGWGPRSLDWFFSGQVTHERRAECVEALSLCRGNGVTVSTKGFSQGLPRDIYVQLMNRTKFMPCPSGPVTVDSFRVCEALMSGAIPIIDVRSPVRLFPSYWSMVFTKECPLPAIENWAELPNMLEQMLNGWETKASVVTAWWSNQLHQWRRDLFADVGKLKL